MGDFERLKNGTSLVPRFLIFALRNRIRHNSSSGLDVRSPVLRDQRAEPYARIQIAREIKVKDRTRVDSPPRRLEFVNDLHGADLGGTRKRSGRKASHQRIEAVDVLPQTSAKTRCQMHYVRVALDEH